MTSNLKILCENQERKLHEFKEAVRLLKAVPRGAQLGVRIVQEDFIDMHLPCLGLTRVHLGSWKVDIRPQWYTLIL
jgi:hypothetical protein